MYSSSFTFDKLKSFSHISKSRKSTIAAQTEAYNAQIKNQSTPNSTDSLHWFFGGCLMPDGKVLFAPSHYSYVCSFDPETGAFSELYEHNLSTVKSYYGAVLLNDSQALFVPYRETDIGIYDYSNNTLTQVATGLDAVGNHKFVGGVMTKDRSKVILIPYNAEYVGIYDVKSGTYSDGYEHGLGVGAAAFTGGSLLPNGKIFMCASNASNHIIYDPESDTVTDEFTNESSEYSWGTVLLNNGDVVLVPCRGDNVKTYRYALNQITTDVAVETHSTKLYVSGSLMQDGRVMFGPYSSDSIGIYDPTNNTYMSSIDNLDPNSPNSEKFSACVTCKDGVVLVPALNRRIYTIIPNDDPVEFNVNAMCNQFL